jgi:hypothetical protein
MVGKADMTVHGWRQLIKWSIEHACVDEKERLSLSLIMESSLRCLVRLGE